MRCEDFLDGMDDYLEASLPEEAHRRLAAHLSECAKCRQRVRATQSLLCRTASLPRTISPDYDLWPAIVTKIRTAEIRQRNTSWAMRFRWGWRLAAVVAAVAALVLAATLVITHHPEGGTAPPVPSLPRNGLNEKAPQRQRPSLPALQGPAKRRDNNATPAQSAEALPAHPMNAGACQCEPTADILSLVENALRVDESLPPSRAEQAASDRLFAFARENGDEFFLLKISLDVLPFPYVSDTVRDRYRRLLLEHPKDPGATYLYAYSLYGRNTAEMIRLMTQLTAEYPDFPWPNLALARVYGYPNAPVDMSQSGYLYNHPDRVQSYLSAFMKLCPESPEPIRIRFPVTDPDFFSSTLSRMRELLVKRTDTRSLLMYPALWRLELSRWPGDLDTRRIRQLVSEDLKRLQGLAAGRPAEFVTVLLNGYQEIGKMDTLQALLEKDTSYAGRSAYVRLDSQDWSAGNPAPPADAGEQTTVAYWEKRLRRNDVWIKKAPEVVFVWLDRLKALSELNGHSESEFSAAADRALSLLRAGEDSSPLDFLRLATLYANRGVRLNQVPALIRESAAEREKRDHQYANDLIASADITEAQKFHRWEDAADVWQALFEAYLRLEQKDKARTALDEIEKGMAEWRQKIPIMQSNTQIDNERPRPAMTDDLRAREQWLSSARARLASKKQTAADADRWMVSDAKLVVRCFFCPGGAARP